METVVTLNRPVSLPGDSQAAPKGHSAKAPLGLATASDKLSPELGSGSAGRPLCHDNTMLKLLIGREMSPKVKAMGSHPSPHFPVTREVPLSHHSESLRAQPLRNCLTCSAQSPEVKVMSPFCR